MGLLYSTIYTAAPLGYIKVFFKKMNVVFDKTEKLGNTTLPAFLFLVLEGTGVDGGTKPFTSWPRYEKWKMGNGQGEEKGEGRRGSESRVSQIP